MTFPIKKELLLLFALCHVHCQQAGLALKLLKRNTKGLTHWEASYLFDKVSRTTRCKPLSQHNAEVFSSVCVCISL